MSFEQPQPQSQPENTNSPESFQPSPFENLSAEDIGGVVDDWFDRAPIVGEKNKETAADGVFDGVPRVQDNQAEMAEVVETPGVGSQETAAVLDDNASRVQDNQAETTEVSEKSDGAVTVSENDRRSLHANASVDEIIQAQRAAEASGDKTGPVFVIEEAEDTGFEEHSESLMQRSNEVARRDGQREKDEKEKLAAAAAAERQDRIDRGEIFERKEGGPVTKAEFIMESLKEEKARVEELKRLGGRGREVLADRAYARKRGIQRWKASQEAA